jgi:site-specific recombinase XerD
MKFELSLNKKLNLGEYIMETKLSQTKQDIISLYSDKINQEDISDKYAKDIIKKITDFSISLGCKEYAKVDVDDFKDYYNTINKGDIKKTTIESYRNILRKFLEWYARKQDKSFDWRKVELEIIKVFRQKDIKKNLLLDPLERLKGVKERTINKYLNSENLLDIQKQKLKEYDNYRKSGISKTVSIHCRVGNLGTLHEFGTFIKKPFEDVIKKDIQEYIAYKREKDLSSATIDAHKIRIIIFYKFLTYGRVDKDDKYPDIVSDIKLEKLNKIKTKEEMLSQEEIKALIGASDNIRDSLVVSLIYEGALRLSEASSIKLGDIKHDDHGFLINFRRIKRKEHDHNYKKVPFRIIESEPYLREYLRYYTPHNIENNPDAPLFILKKAYGCAMGGEAIARIIRKLAIRAEIKKRVHPHLLRHSRITYWRQQNLGDHNIISLVGWKEDTKMLSVYAHTDIEDANKELLKRSGKLQVVKKEENKLQPIKCSRCSITNPVGASYCYECGQALDRIQALEDDANKDKAIDQAFKLMQGIMKDPELFRKYQKFELT